MPAGPLVRLGQGAERGAAPHLLGGPCKALTVVGGSIGEAVRRDLDRVGLAARWVSASAPTRVCTTILDSAHIPRPSWCPRQRPLAPDELAAFQAAYAEEAKAAAVVVLIGSLPPEAPPAFYRGLSAQMPSPAVVDARGDELLEALAEKPLLVKPNRDELAKPRPQSAH